MAQTVKNLPAMQETQVWSLDWEDPLEKEMVTHSSILAWRIPWIEEPGSYSSWGHRVRHNWETEPNIRREYLKQERNRRAREERKPESKQRKLPSVAFITVFLALCLPQLRSHCLFNCDWETGFTWKAAHSYRSFQRPPGSLMRMTLHFNLESFFTVISKHCLT